MSARGGEGEPISYEIVTMSPPRKPRRKGRPPEWELPLEQLEVGQAVICTGSLYATSNVAASKGWDLGREFRVRTLADGRIGVFRVQ